MKSLRDRGGEDPTLQVSPQLFKTLESIVGPSFVLTRDSKKFEDYSIDMGGNVSKPGLVAAPENTEQVSRILKILNAEKFPVVARGAGTSLTGATSSFGGVVIDFSKRMNRIIRIDTTNWYAHCEAGVVLDDLNQELKRHGFFFPPDPASTPWCTVGGVISENSGGMRTFRFGTVRNWVLALNVVFADGTIAKLGEPLPKNRVGYDLVRLVCGSEGTLALITDAWLKIAPLPGSQGSEPVKKFMVFFSTWNDAAISITALRSKGLEPNLLEFISRQAIRAVNASFDTNVPEHEAILLMEAPSPLIEKILETCRSNRAVDSYIAKDEADGDRLYSARALVNLGIKTLGSGMYNEDVVVPLDALAEYLGFVQATAKKYSVKIPAGGHAGDGNVHPAIIFDKDSEESRENAGKAFAELIREAVRLGGSVSGEHGIGLQKLIYAKEQLMERNGEKVIDLMRALKRMWDPNNILNPGKFVV